MQANTDRLLLLIHPDDTQPKWLATWTRSYPHSLQIALPGHNLPDTWQHLPDEQPVFIIAHQTTAWLDWYYHADILSRRRIIGIILHLPTIHPDDTAIWQAIRFDCPTAIVLPDHHPNQQLAQQLAQTSRARLIIEPESPKGNWQWGMKLMQEMLLSNDKN